MELNNNKQTKNKTFTFKPLSKGLGFHVFSDGFPYKSEKGSPSLPQRTLYTQPSLTTPLPSPSLASMEERSVAKTILKNPQKIEPIVYGKKKKAKSTTPVRRYSFYYLPKRVFAYFTDTLFHSSLCFFLLFILSQHMNVPFAAIQNLDSLFFASIFIFIFNWALILAEEVALGFTLGKKIFGLYIDAPPFVLLARSILFLVGFFSFGIGLWIALFTPDKKTWHDLVTHVQPEETK